MMSKLFILEDFESDGYHITKYTMDGKTISHEIKRLIMDDSTVEEAVPEPSIEEKILYETQYQTMLIETSMSF